MMAGAEGRRYILARRSHPIVREAAMTMHRFAVGLLVVAVAACGGARAPRTSSGPSEYTVQVRGYLERLGSNAEKQGFSRVVSGPVYGSLNDDAEGSHDMTVSGGTEYVIFGACDNDCTDLDLLIYDADGGLVRRDVAADDRPVLVFTPRKSGKYKIKVVMAICADEPCRYGLQLNAKK